MYFSVKSSVVDLETITLVVADLSKDEDDVVLESIQVGARFIYHLPVIFV